MKVYYLLFTTLFLLLACSKGESCNCNNSSSLSSSGQIDYVKLFEQPINYTYKLSEYNLVKNSPEFKSMSLSFRDNGAVSVSWELRNGEKGSSSFGYTFECKKENVIKAQYKYTINIHYSNISGDIAKYFDFSSGYAWELSTYYDKIEYTGIGRDSVDELQNGAKSGYETATFLIDKSVLF